MSFLDEAFGLAKQAYDYVKSVSVGDQQSYGYSVEEIGRPFMFPDTVDPQTRAYRFLATRMNIIDLYPCNYAQSHLYSADASTRADNKKSFFKYGVGYNLAMSRYKRMCTDYLGISNPPSALRIFLTDDTVVTDGVSTMYKENFFQTAANKLSELAQGFTSMAASLSSASIQTGVDRIIGDNIDSQKIAADVAGGLNLGQGSQDVLGGIVDKLKAGAAIVLKGNKLSLPKIWENSNYTANFSISTKLFSPYGSPKAVKEYIIKPLAMMLMMGIPQSDDMTSYGRPFAVTVRSWGTSFLSLAGITSITLQRGGSDSIYNIYKQPLVINVNMEFQSLVDGVLAFGTDRSEIQINDYEKNSFRACDQILPLNSQSQNIDGSVLPTVVPTLGGIIRSLQPVQFSGLTYGYGPQQSTRDDIMIGGNGDAGGGGVFDAINVGIMSAFNAAYGYANNSANSQGGFGDTLLGGLSNTVNGIASGISGITGTLNQTLGAATQLANTVTLGAFRNTGFARSLGKFQNNVSQNTRYLNQAAGAVTGIKSALNTASSTLGSLLNFQV